MEWFKGNLYLLMANSCDSTILYRYINKLQYLTIIILTKLIFFKFVCRVEKFL